jgi:hypothetical protein
VFVADQHFSKGKKLMRDPLFRTAVKKRSGESFTKLQKAYNNNLYRLRARIERPFGWIDHNYESLAKPWREPLEQLDLAVMFASGLFNAVQGQS